MRFRIRDAREAKGWSQAELAMRAGTTQQSIQRYEAGTSEPKISALIGIAKACGVSISYLLGIAEEGGTAPETLTYDEQRLVHLYRMCDDRGRATVTRVAEAELLGRSEPWRAE